MSPVTTTDTIRVGTSQSLVLSKRASRVKRLASLAGTFFLFAITSLSTVAVLFIIYYIARDAIPFFQIRGVSEFIGSARWYPSAEQPEFGAKAIFIGSGLVTLGAVLFAVPLGISAALCLSDVLPFKIRQVVKPVIEMLAAIPSVAFGFFALVIFAPLLQNNGGTILAIISWVVFLPIVFLGTIVISDLLTQHMPDPRRQTVRIVVMLLGGLLLLSGLFMFSRFLSGLTISSGTNALNVSIILGIMALPTIVTVSEDALQSVGRELREGSYALGATRAETLVKTILPAASSGICAAVILGVMRAIGETMVVWMASGNAAQIPKPWFNFLEPVRTLTATIAGDMGEADHTTGSARYHVLFAMALSLLLVSFAANLASEWIVARQKKKMGM